jgi:hypothetical protein
MTSNIRLSTLEGLRYYSLLHDWWEWLVLPWCESPRVAAQEHSSSQVEQQMG